MAMTEKPKKSRESFVMRCKWSKSLKYLNDGDYRRMMEAMFDFAESGVKPEFENPMLMAVWTLFEVELSKDYENWLAVCERNKENRLKGLNKEERVVIDGNEPLQVSTSRHQSSPAVTSRHQSSPAVTSRDQSSPVVTTGEDSDYDYDLNREKKIQKEKTSFSFDADIFENLKERVNKLFNRRSSTAWSDKETKQLKAIAKREDVLDELTEIETLYNSGYEYRRKDVITFLNNFATELDRARNYNQRTCPNQGETSSEAEPMYRDYAEPAPIAGRETPVRSRADTPALNFGEDEND